MLWEPIKITMTAKRQGKEQKARANRTAAFRRMLKADMPGWSLSVKHGALEKFDKDICCPWRDAPPSSTTYTLLFSNGKTVIAHTDCSTYDDKENREELLRCLKDCV